jgi:hypothetical protein
VGDAEFVDTAVEGIGDAAPVPADAKGSRVEIDGERIAHLRDAGAVEVEALVVGAGILVIGADDVAQGPFPSVPAMSCCSRLSGPNAASIVGQSIPKGLTLQRAIMLSSQAAPNAP